MNGDTSSKKELCFEEAMIQEMKEANGVEREASSRHHLPKLAASRVCDDFLNITLSKSYRAGHEGSEGTTKK